MAVLLKLKRFCASFPCSPEHLYSVAWLFGLFTEKCYAEPTTEQLRHSTSMSTLFLLLAGTASVVADPATGDAIELQSYKPLSLPNPPNEDGKMLDYFSAREISAGITIVVMAGATQIKCGPVNL